MQLFNKLLSLLFLFFGEAFSIYAEMDAAKAYGNGESHWLVFLKTFVIITIGGGFLLAGYMMGYRVFKNIWVIAVLSTAFIVIVEPILAFAFFHSLPKRGELIGLILAALGLVAMFTL